MKTMLNRLDDGFDRAAGRRFGALTATMFLAATMGGCPTTNDDVAGDQTGSGAPGVAGPQGPAGPQGTPGTPGAAGLDCWDTNGNGVGEAAEDLNGDGAFNAADCQGAVPDGAFLLSDSESPPAGFVFTGISFDSGDFWSTAESLPAVLAGHAFVAVGEAAFAIGGLRESGGSNASVGDVFRYEAATDTWTTREPMPTARALHSAVAVGGKIYAIGGAADTFLATVEEYDPLTNIWTPRADMPTARQAAMAAEVGGKIFVIGGQADGSEVLATVEVYDPATNTWGFAADIPTARIGAAVAAIGGKIYVAGGATVDDATGDTILLDTLEEYDPATNSWTGRSSMPRALLVPASAAAADKLYVMGGAEDVEDTTGSDFVGEYDPQTDEWRTRFPMSTARLLAAAATIGDEIFVPGGSSDGQTILASHEAFAVPSRLFVHAKE